MRHYEIVFLVHPDQSEQVPSMIERYRDIVGSNGGIMHREEDWGRRRLAYMINNVYKAHYVMVNIECDLEVLADIERNFKFNDSILRYLIIRRKSAITEDSVMAMAKAVEDAKEADRAEAAQAEADRAEAARAEADRAEAARAEADRAEAAQAEAAQAEAAQAEAAQAEAAQAEAQEVKPEIEEVNLETEQETLAAPETEPDRT